MRPFCSLGLFITFLIPLCADNGGSTSSGNFKASLTGYDEVLPVWTPATGDITVQVDVAAAKITITLQYSNLNASPATAVRLYWGQSAVNGQAILTVCGGSPNVCPTNGAQPATFTFTAQALQAVSQPGFKEYFPAANLNAFIDSLTQGVVYANISTQQFPNGEIRGQLGHGNSASNGRGGGPKR